jgi:hypothetical protein
MRHVLVIEVETEEDLPTEEVIKLFEEMFSETTEINGTAIVVQRIVEYWE